MTFDPWESLLDAARSGSDWAWSDLYREYAPKVRGYALSQGVADPDDLVGEVFLQAVRNLPSFTGGEEGFRSWLFTIVHRRIIDTRRRARRRPERLTDTARDPRTTPSAEDLAALGIENEPLRVALESLSVDQRQVLALRVIADLSIEEVARILNKKDGAVKALQHRALQRLRKSTGEAVTK